MKELGLTASLLNSVTGVLKDSSTQQAEQNKAMNEKLGTQYANRMGVARPRTAEEARVATLEGRAPQRRISDSINQVYAKSVAEHNARVKEEAAAIEKAYAKMGASKPISESVDEACSSKMKAAKKEFKAKEEAVKKSHEAKARDAVDEETQIEEATAKGSETGDRFEMKSHSDGTASIIKTHQGGKSLKNEHGGFPTYKTGKKAYIQKHFDKLGEEVTLTAEEIAAVAELAKKFEEQ